MKRKAHSFWTYQASEPTPTHAEAVEAGAFGGTETEWHQLSPGMRREILRTAKKLKPLA